MTDITIITTVGTSLLTNYNNDLESILANYSSIKEELKNLYAAEKENNFNFEDEKNKCESDLTSIKDLIKSNFFKNIHKKNTEWEIEAGVSNYDCCAEIKTLKNLIEKIETIKKDVKDINKYNLYFITTDTLASNVSAELILDFINNDEYFKKLTIIPKIIKIDKIGVYNYNDFKSKGFKNLLKEISSIPSIKESIEKKDTNNNYFNISGGYKGLIPFITIFAQVYNVEMSYMYEDSDSLISIPKLPINYDLSYAELWYPFFIKNETEEKYTYRKSEEQIIGFKSKETKGSLKDLQLIEITKEATKDISGEYELTVLGELFKLFLDKKDETSENILGFIMESKVYEYFIENKYKSFNYVKRSIDLPRVALDGKEDKTSEIDIVLSTENFDKNIDNVNSDFIGIEIKSYTTFIKDEMFEKLVISLKRQFSALFKNNKLENLKEYYLIIYSLSDWNKTEVIKTLLKQKKELIEKLKDFNKNNIRVKFFHFSQELKTKDNENPYKKLASSEIKLLEEILGE